MSDNLIVMPRSKLSSIATFVGIALLAVIIVIGYLAYKKIMEENIKLRNEVTQFKELTDTLVRSSTQWTTKKQLKEELKTLLRPEDLKALRDDIKTQGARLSAVGRTIGSLNKKVAKLEKSDRTGPENTEVVMCDDGRLIDVHQYTKRPQIKKITDINKAPIADVQFDASKKAPWNYNVFERKYKLATVVSKKESGQLIFHHNLSYNIPSASKEDYKIKLDTSSFKQVQLGNKMFWLNPRLDLGVFGGGNIWMFASGPGNPNGILSMGLDLGLSLSSYGETKVDSWWRFFRFGAGYDMQRRAAHLSFSPIAFNLGKVMPLITNLYLSPQVGIDSAGGIKLSIGASLQL